VETLSEPRCLYCRKSDGGFARREHPIPESMGNRSIELPPGVVCDRCNGGVLSFLDQTLLEFFPVKLRRTELGIESKAGKVPETAFQDGRLRHNGAFDRKKSQLANDSILLIRGVRLRRRIHRSAQGGRRRSTGARRPQTAARSGHALCHFVVDAVRGVAGGASSRRATCGLPHRSRAEPWISRSHPTATAG
jgi:hypothetical protein